MSRNFTLYFILPLIATASSNAAIVSFLAPGASNNTLTATADGFTSTITVTGSLNTTDTSADWTSSGISPTGTGSATTSTVGISINNNGINPVHSFISSGPAGNAILRVHFWGVFQPLTISEPFTLLSSSNLTQSGNTIEGSVSTANNSLQGRGTIEFTTPVQSFTITEGGSVSDTFRAQFTVAVPEPSSALLVGIASLVGVGCRRRKA